MQLGILGDDLLYTLNGREYLTTARLRLEVEACLRRAGGRLPLIELPALLNVDLVRNVWGKVGWPEGGCR